MKMTALLLALLRIALGWICLWVFLDRLFGLGISTPSAVAWVLGGSPTKSFLAGSSWNFYVAIAGNPIVDWLFMLGLLTIGLALILGIGLRIASIAGTILMLLIWLALQPLRQNPFIDQHIIYAFVFLLLPRLDAGQTFGLANWWSRQPLVQQHPWLR